MPNSPHHSLSQFLVRTRFLYLLVCLTIMLLAVPWYEAAPSKSLVLRLLMTTAVLGGVYAVAGRRRDLIIAVVIAVPTIVTNLTGSRSSELWHIVADYVTTIVFIGFLSVRILTEIYRDERVTVNTLLGAVCAYLLIGWLFATFYQLAGEMSPGSIAGFRSEIPSEAESIYYSFVTLTTLGYGDITPVAPYARALAYVEAIIGQLFPAILIARFVGLHISDCLMQRGA
jgi:hypothetical protein